MAILEQLEVTNFDPAQVLAVDSLVIDMLTLAWYPHVFFRLSFGKQDQITKELERISCDSIALGNMRKITDRESVKKAIRDRFSEQQQLTRYVSYRLIRPFFAQETRKLKDHIVNSRVAELASEYFTIACPLYRFVDDERMIAVHPVWCRYLRQNLPVVRSWAKWKWLEYMQRANPNVPNLSLKLFPPAARQSLQKQTEYWRGVISICDLQCIYTGRSLSVDGFALDHFLPWSFIVSDHLWNLVPVSPEANSAKSDKLPDQSYLSALVKAQHVGLEVSRKSLPESKWLEYAQPFLIDLKLEDQRSLMDQSKLELAYREQLLLLLALAKANGFEDNWIYSPKPQYETINPPPA
jgi:hypothetical protein